MRMITITATALLLLSVQIPAQAKTTRTFSGSNPAEVEKNARKAGYSYPESEMKCSARCNQRWSRD
ncbi:hypothetical protein PMIT1306_00701 [Prochlorococcus sp. MIT 1306]|uniref:hypothetical protein n=2 Tax=Prochlorococcus sp. MIT 1306 TaxID=1799667 RepID=UPI0007B3B54C|nr:hypothetical protein PMIT1306_00701 [Prochlorococcus sp. MIT 1306]